MFNEFKLGQNDAVSNQSNCAKVEDAVDQRKVKKMLVVRNSVTTLDDLYQLGFSYYCLHLYYYIHICRIYGATVIIVGSVGF